MHKKKRDSTFPGTSSFICQNATTITAVFMDIIKSTPCTFTFDRIKMHEAVLPTNTCIS